MGFDWDSTKWFGPNRGEEDNVGVLVELRYLFIGGMGMDGGVEVMFCDVLLELWFEDAIAVEVEVVESWVDVFEGLKNNMGAFGFDQ